MAGNREARLRCSRCWRLYICRRTPSPGQPEEANPQIAEVLSGLQRMSKEQWTEFLRFAELQRVYLRTLQLLQKWSAAGAFVPPFDDFEELEQAEKRQVEDALAP